MEEIISRCVNSESLSKVLSEKTPHGEIIKIMYALYVYTDFSDKKYKNVPKVQNMWAQIPKKVDSFLENLNKALH